MYVLLNLKCLCININDMSATINIEDYMNICLHVNNFSYNIHISEVWSSRRIHGLHILFFGASKFLITTYAILCNFFDSCMKFSGTIVSYTRQVSILVWQWEKGNSECAKIAKHNIFPI